MSISNNLPPKLPTIADAILDLVAKTPAALDSSIFTNSIYRDNNSGDYRAYIVFEDRRIFNFYFSAQLVLEHQKLMMTEVMTENLVLDDIVWKDVPEDKPYKYESIAFKSIKDSNNDA